MRRVVLVLGTLSGTVAVADGGTLREGTSCAERLGRTLTVMQERPLLKEEHATALMWLRMDAAKAAAAGDEAACDKTVAIVEDLLGLNGRAE